MNCLKIQQHIRTITSKPNGLALTNKKRTFQIQLSKCLQSPCLERVWQTFQLNDSRAFGMKFASNGNAMPRSVNFKLCQASCSNKNGETLSFTTYVKWKTLIFSKPMSYGCCIRRSEHIAVLVLPHNAARRLIKDTKFSFSWIFWCVKCRLLPHSDG